MKHFSYIGRNSALVITHCEGLTAHAREGVVENFVNSIDTKDIAAFMGKGIYAVGFPALACCDQSLQSPYLHITKRDVENLMQLIKRSNNFVDVVPTKDCSVM